MPRVSHLIHWDCATGCLPSQSKGCGTPVSKGGARASGEGSLPAADWGAGRDASLPTDASGECGRVGTAREGRGRRLSRVLLPGISEGGSRLSRIRQKDPADASPRSRVGTKAFKGASGCIDSNRSEEHTSE